MAVIINTAMVRVVCAAYDGFRSAKFGEFLPHIVYTFAWKWVTRMHFTPVVVMDSRVYELACHEIDKVVLKGHTKLSTAHVERIAQKAVGRTSMKLENDIQVEMVMSLLLVASHCILNVWLFWLRRILTKAALVPQRTVSKSTTKYISAIMI